MIHHTKAINSFLDYVKVQLPIIQAPMAGVQDSKLAIAVPSRRIGLTPRRLAQPTKN